MTLSNIRHHPATVSPTPCRHATTRPPRFRGSLKPLKSACKTVVIPLATTLSVNHFSVADEANGFPLVLEEIVVYAQKRAQSLQDVPVSITAFTSTTIEDRNIVGLSDIATATPNLTYLTDGTLKNTSPSIRGVFSPGAAQAGLDTPLAIYVDEVYLGGSVGQDFEMFDIERIEVLRGPQGTLFGRNALSGLINIVTKQPGEEVEGFGEVTGGNYDLLRVRAGVSGPLVENRLFGSISASHLDRGGYVDNQFTHNKVNDAGNWSLRSKLLYIASDRVEATLAIDYREVDQTSRNYDIAGFNGSPGVLFQPFGPAIVDQDPFDRKISQNFDGEETLEEFGAALTIDADWDNLQFKSITSYRTHEYFQSYDADNTEIDITRRETPDDLDAYGQEFRLTSATDKSIDWIAGVNYYYQKTVNEFASFLNNDVLVGDRLFSTLLPAQAFGLTPELLALFGFTDTLHFATALGILTPPFGETRSIGTTELDSYAVYAHGNWHITDKLNLQFGVRYNYEDKAFDYAQTSAPGNIFFQLPEIAALERDRDFESLTPSVGIDYKPGENTLFYVKVAEGFKSGGFNDGFASEPGNFFDKETLWNYEIGVKTSLLDQRLDINTSVFYMDWQDRQSDFQVFPAGSVVPFFIFDTAGDVKITGVEFEAFAQVTERLSASVALGHIDSEYASVSPRLADLGAQKGDPLVSVPEYSGNLSVQYVFPVGQAGKITLAGHLNYRDDVPLTVITTNVANTQDAYTLFDASIGFTSNDGLWAIQLWGKNLGDEDYVTAQFNIDGAQTSPIRAVYHALGAPRTYGLKLRRNF